MEGKSIHSFLLALTDSHRTLLESPVDDATLRDVFIKYGRSASHCYKLATNPLERDAWEHSIPIALRNIPDPATFSINLAGHNVDARSDAIIEASSQLITIFPDKHRMPRVDLVSKHVAMHLYAIIEDHNEEDFWKYFNQFWSV